MKMIAVAAAAASLVLAPAAFAEEASQPVGSGPEATGVQIKKGDVLYSSGGRRLGTVYRIAANGDAQVIIQSRIVTVPAAIISEVDGKLVASVASSRELLRGK